MMDRMRLAGDFAPWRAVARPGRWVGVVGLLLLCILTVPFFSDSRAPKPPRAVDGTISYAGWGALDRPVTLAGEWRFRWLEPTDVATPERMAVPGTWAGGSEGLPAAGRAIYEVSLVGLQPGRYTLHVPPVYGASRVLLDGRELSRRGTLGDDAASTIYLTRAHFVHFETDGAPVTVGIEMATFRHRDNGLLNLPLLGLNEPMETWVAMRWSQELLFIATLVLLGVFSMVVYLYRRQDRASLYFALAALLFLPLSAEQGFDNLLVLLFPGLEFWGQLALMYFCTLGSMMAFISYTHHLFPQESPRRLYQGAQALMVGGILAHALGFAIGGTLLVSKVNISIMLLLAVMALYAIYVLVRAVQRQRDGALVLLLGLGSFLIISFSYALSSYDFLPRDPFLGTDLASFSAIIMLFSNIIVVAERWSASISASERLNDDLRELLDVSLAITSEIQLDVLLAKIVSGTTNVLRADRSTLFIHDARTNELYTMAAEGISTREIRMPPDMGLAGQAFTSGETINVPDAYRDPRFNREMDKRTGYRSRNILSMPVTTRDGRRIGVMQALNRHQPGPFDADDIERMRAFAAQAAVALDNASLFREVMGSRNYNESILRSMSSGVISLDIDGRVVKRNPAATTILGLAQTEEDQSGAQSFVDVLNPWLGVEMAMVRDSGEAKMLLDTDIVTVVGKKSANVSVVPLVDGETQQGFLILIEDISQGKRLEGAMRRFMTQKIVDQVMARDDGLMFGSAVQASVLFADIRNFTSMTESLGPRQTVDMLNSVFSDLYDAVSEADGVLDKFIGDAVMAVYGAPLPGSNDAGNAVASALRMQSMIREINARRAGEGQPPIGLGIGIATGEVVAGTIGSPKRMDYTVIGDSVNLAARLQDLTKLYGLGLIVCEETAAANGGALLREIDLIRVRGRKRPARIFEILPDGPAPAWHLDYQLGRERLAGRDWEGAIAAFDAVLAACGEDGPTILMRARAQSAMRIPPPADWDGVW